MSPERVCRAWRLVTVVGGLGTLLIACDRTSIDDLNVRAEPSTTSAVVGTIPDVDTRVEIECHTRGEAVHDDTVWYRISEPVAGYVTNYYVETTGDSLAQTDPC